MTDTIQANRLRTPTRAGGRSGAVKIAQERARSQMTLEGRVYPCLWCGDVLDEARVKNALMRGKSPKYCGQSCRRNEPARSLVSRIFSASLSQSAVSHEEDLEDVKSIWKDDFTTRIAIATAGGRFHSAQPAGAPKRRRK